jgi:transcriptional regulator GlxA family with amidase domain
MGTKHLKGVTLWLVMLAMVTTGAIHAEETKPTRTLGVLLFPGFEMLDASGPMEMWGNMGNKVRMVPVAAVKGPVASAQGVKMVAEYDFADCPPLDLVLVPGGISAFKVLREEAVLKWLRAVSAKAEITMSVCNGASILAAAGLLDGRRATTNKAFWTDSTAPGPKVIWVRKARWVDDGNMVTSSGVSAGIDMTLHVIARLYGLRVAERLAQVTEYEWHRDPDWDPFADLPEARKAAKRPD